MHGRHRQVAAFQAPQDDERARSLLAAVTARYAIYVAPDAGSPLARFGAAWLGRDAETGARVARPAVEGFGDERLEQITETPRGYGFHATLAPPMRLAEGCTAGMLADALTAFAAGRAPFLAPPLRLSHMKGFLALMLSAGSDAMQALEDDTIRTFERFRAPPSAAELARREDEGLTPRQEELFRAWGYPYVLDEFRFHMTLSCELDAPELQALRTALAPLTAPLCTGPLEVGGIALFEQETLGAPFMLAGRYPFAA